MQPFLTVLIALGTLGHLVDGAAGDSKAAALVAQARAAIGGDKRIGTIQGLSCSGTVQRMVGDRQVAGEMTIDVQLPDKMLRTESISLLGDVVVVTEQGINGDTVLRKSRTLNAPPGAVIRTPPPPAPGSEAEVQSLRTSRAELVRFVVAMLLTPPPSSPLEFTDGGEAEAPDGKADVLDVKGAGTSTGFAAKLFLDKSSHRPLMLAYRGVAPRIIVQAQRDGGAPPQRAEGPPQGAPELVDITMFFDDYRPVEGVMMPHHITRSVGGKPNEEWTFKTIKVNPAFKLDLFSPK